MKKEKLRIIEFFVVKNLREMMKNVLLLLSFNEKIRHIKK